MIWLLAVLLQDDATRAKQLLEAAAAAMKDAPAVAFECRLQWKGVDFSQKLAVKLKRPNLARIESGDDAEYLYVLDGTAMWAYVKASNQYLRTSRPDGVFDSLGVGPFATVFYGAPADVLGKATSVSLRDERSGDERFEVVTWTTSSGESRLWIDGKKSVRRYEFRMKVNAESYEMNIDYLKVDFQPKLADDAFVFVAPRDAKEIRSADEPVDAPDFEGDDQNGAKVKLSSFRGKPVVLVFWSPSTRDALARAEKIRQEHGVVVLGVSAPHQEKAAFPLLAQRKDEISAAYRVIDLPAYILVGADGKILARGEGAVRAELDRRK